MQAGPPPSKCRSLTVLHGFDVMRALFAWWGMITVAIVDNCRLWTSALEKCLAGEPAMQLVSVIPSIPLAREVIARHAPRVVAIRLGAADTHIHALSRALIRESPGLSGLVYSLSDYDPLDEAWALASGFRGYVGPYDGMDALVSALRVIGEGGTFFVRPAGLLEADECEDDDGDCHRKLRHLSAREIEVFRMTGHGHCCKDIANKIGIHIKTVDTYRTRIRRKLGLNDSGDLLRTAIRLNRPASVRV